MKIQAFLTKNDLRKRISFFRDTFSIYFSRLIFKTLNVVASKNKESYISSELNETINVAPGEQY